MCVYSRVHVGLVLWAKVLRIEFVRVWKVLFVFHDAATRDLERRKEVFFGGGADKPIYRVSIDGRTCTIIPLGTTKSVPGTL